MLDLIVCTTCGDASPRQGEQLHQQLAEAATDNIRVHPFKCLMACKRSCSVQLRAPNKFAYVIGDLAPDAQSVSGLLSFCQHYDESADGKVAFANWPPRVKGHFVSRMPPEFIYKEE